MHPAHTAHYASLRVPLNVELFRVYSNHVSRPDLSLARNNRDTRAPPFHTQRALERLEDIPRLLEDAVAYERLALMKSLFEKIWIEDRRIVKLTPRAEVGEILASALHVVSGVPNGSWGSRINSVAPYSIIAS